MDTGFLLNSMLSWYCGFRIFKKIKSLSSKLSLFSLINELKLFLIKKNTFENEFNLEDYGIDLIKEDNKILVDTIKWNGHAKKSGIEMGDYITEFKIENLNRPSKLLVYPFALFLLLIFGYLNKRKTI